MSAVLKNFLHVAVKHMAASLAVEWAKKNVRVNVLRYVRNIIKVYVILTSFRYQPRLHAHQTHQDHFGTRSRAESSF